MIRKSLKLLAFSLAMVAVSPLVVLTWIEKRLAPAEAVFATCAQLVAVVPGPVGHYCRAAFYFGTLDACSWQTHIGFGSMFTHRAATIASHVSTGAYCIIGHADVGEGVRLASRVSIPSGKRQHLDEAGRLTHGTVYTQVAIGPGAWIGEAATILADVGPRAIVSAGAVVIDAVPGDCIAGGNPARVIKSLDGGPQDRGGQ